MVDEQPAHLVDYMLRLREERISAEKALRDKENEISPHGRIDVDARSE